MTTNKKLPALLLAAALLLGVAAAASAGVWTNRRFFFKEYIYTELYRPLEGYSAELYARITGLLSPEPENQFAESGYGVYYSVTLSDTGVTHSNLPQGVSADDFSLREDVVTLPVSYTLGDPAPLMSGYAFIDLGAEELLPEYFRYTLDTGFKQRGLLFLELAALVGGLLLAAPLVFLSRRRGDRLTAVAQALPVDALPMGAVLSAALLPLFWGDYQAAARLYSQLGRRGLLFGVTALLSAALILCLAGVFAGLRGGRYRRGLGGGLLRHVPSWSVLLLLMTAAAAAVAWLFSGADYADYLRFLGDHLDASALTFGGILAFCLVYRAYRRGRERHDREVLLNAQEEAAEQQKRIERQRYELVTNISHDLRTPLTSILNYVGLLKRAAPPGDFGRYLNHVDENAERLHLLIEDLFELSKIESGSLPLKRGQTDLVLLLRQILHERTAEFAAAGLEAVLEHTAEHLVVDCDNLKIWRVFDNLIGNALKYSLRGTRVFVTLEGRDGGAVRAVVRNTASCRLQLPPEEYFQRFRRGDESRGTEGSGLGLSIARGLTELHGGHMDIEIEGDMFRVIVAL
jgi:signal transduction histidine kinase